MVDAYAAMKITALFVLAGLATGAAVSQPQADEMAELRAADPNNYAVVQALLAKQSMGLLNPRHPSEGFASTGPHLSAEGAASLAKMEAEVKPRPAPVEAREEVKAAAAQPLYPEAGAAQHNWMNFKAEDSDDAVLASVGVSVGPDDGSLLSEGKAAQSIMPPSIPDDPSPLAPSRDVGGMQIPIIDWGGSAKKAAPQPPPVAAAVVAPVPAQASLVASSTASYNAPGGIDFGSLIPAVEKQAPKPKVAMSQDESDLGSLDLKDDLPTHGKGWKPPAVKQVEAAAPTEAPVTNALTQFDFNTAAEDDARTGQAQVEDHDSVTNSYLSKVSLRATVPTAQDHANPYMKLMGMDQTPDASLIAQRAPVAQRVAPQPSNGYLRAIHFNGVRRSKSLYGDFEADLEG